MSAIMLRMALTGYGIFSPISNYIDDSNFGRKGICMFGVKSIITTLSEKDCSLIIIYFLFPNLLIKNLFYLAFLFPSFPFIYNLRVG